MTDPSFYTTYSQIYVEIVNLRHKNQAAEKKLFYKQ